VSAYLVLGGPLRVYAPRVGVILEKHLRVLEHKHSRSLRSCPAWVPADRGGIHRQSTCDLCCRAEHKQNPEVAGLRPDVLPGTAGRQGEG